MASQDEIFETYQREYETLVGSIQAKITALADPSATPATQRPRVVNQAKRELEEVDEILGQMDVELASLPAMARSRLTPRVRTLRDQTKRLQAELQKAAASAGAGGHAADRDALLGTTYGTLEAGGGAGAAPDARGRLVSQTNRLENGTRQLEEVNALALETEAGAYETLEHLSRQREQLERTRDTMTGVNGWIAKSQGLLKSMQRHLATNRLITWMIVILLVILILVVIFLKWG
ncbi:hypothetical protein CXG81DRAFT_16658 [Caulochytrium protostelioides]|uniref:Vesicle transport v-SNARE N-terminal domain-containing protein n=1 Tax=Caulochytrium protostelioides TaxID=1555241 RepID=A0A4P9XE74_9FUNG|nr:hypothetical protein CXG81DRAFT_16658 [Caulochytrium protostelioides]|eukprot:RKP03823.1 hypothetical protein CXG81DRAFT_16658 [Caulochytrium protostelioides]